MTHNENKKITPFILRLINGETIFGQLSKDNVVSLLEKKFFEVENPISIMPIENNGVQYLRWNTTLESKIAYINGSNVIMLENMAKANIKLYLGILSTRINSTEEEEEKIPNIKNLNMKGYSVN